MSKEKTHINRGIRKYLEIPNFYNGFQNVIGSPIHRKKHYLKHFSHGKLEKILDIGCGTGALLDYLNENIEYHGYDMEQSYIKYAKEKYGTRGNFHCEKVGTTINQEWIGYFDAINANALIHHLSDSDTNDLFKVAHLYLKPGGFLITVDSVFHDDQAAISKWLVSRDRGQNIRTPDEYLQLARKFFTTIEHELKTDHLRIPYSVFMMKMFKD